VFKEAARDFQNQTWINSQPDYLNVLNKRDITPEQLAKMSNIEASSIRKYLSGNSFKYSLYMASEHI
jgi:predicted transcriptional regulator